MAYLHTSKLTNEVTSCLTVTNVLRRWGQCKGNCNPIDEFIEQTNEHTHTPYFSGGLRYSKDKSWD